MKKSVRWAIEGITPSQDCKAQAKDCSIKTKEKISSIIEPERTEIQDQDLTVPHQISDTTMEMSMVRQEPSLILQLQGNLEPQANSNYDN